MKEYQMHASILQTPTLLEQCLHGSIRKKIQEYADILIEKKIEHIVFIGCGTSYMIAQAAVAFFHAYAQMDCRCERAYELLTYPSFTLHEHDALIALSHSGGTKAVCDVVAHYRSKNIVTIGFSEVEHSRLEKASEYFLLGPGGKDSATPKTRSFSTGVFMLLLLAAEIGERKQLPVDWKEITSMPRKAQAVLSETEDAVVQLVEQWKVYAHYVLVGSGTNAVTTQEGSLKLLETANVCALSTTIEELAHGNELYLNDSYGVIMIDPDGCKGQQRLEQMIEGTLLTKAHVCVITNSLRENVSYTQIVLQTKTTEILSMLLFILPLQLFAYHLAVALGANPDLSTGIYEHMQQAIAKFHPPGYH